MELLANFDDILTTLGGSSYQKIKAQAAARQLYLSYESEGKNYHFQGNKTLTEATLYEASCYGDFILCLSEDGL